MKNVFIIFLLFPFFSFSQDTLQMGQERVDNLINSEHQYTGVAVIEPKKLMENDHFHFYESFTPKYYYYNFSEGKFLFMDEVQYFRDSSGAVLDHPFYSKLHSHDVLNKFYEKRYYKVDSLQSLSKTEIINDTNVTYEVNYAKAGKLFSHGHYYNGSEHGDWPTYLYNDTILFTEVWTHGFLTGVKSNRTIFVGEKNKIISQQDYFKIIKNQGGIQWNVIAVPEDKLNNPNKVAFIMYSELLDFEKFMEKKWEDDKFIDILLKRNEKYLMKQE